MNVNTHNSRPTAGVLKPLRETYENQPSGRRLVMSFLQNILISSESIWLFEKLLSKGPLSFTSQIRSESSQSKEKQSRPQDAKEM